jgi:hypothetical protein
MQLKFLLLFFPLLLMGISKGFSQKFILLQRGANEKTRLEYEIGESITYKTKTYDFFITDVIKDIQKDVIVLSENILRPENITVIDITNKDPRNITLTNLSYLSYGAGVIFLLAEGINSIYQEGQLSISRGGLITTSALISSGFILSKLKYRYFRNRGRNKIQLVLLYGD